MNNIRGSFRAGERRPAQRKVATPLASSQLHRRSPAEVFPPECHAFHAPLPLQLSTYSSPSALDHYHPPPPPPQAPHQTDYVWYGEVYFPLSIPPCISHCRLAFGATNLSFLNSIPEPATSLPPRGWGHLHSDSRRDIHTFCKYPPSLFAIRGFQTSAAEDALKRNLRGTRLLSLEDATRTIFATHSSTLYLRLREICFLSSSLSRLTSVTHRTSPAARYAFKTKLQFASYSSSRSPIPSPETRSRESL